MQADVERTKDRDRTREAYTPAEVVPDLADQFAAGSTFDRVHPLSQPNQVTIRDCRTERLKRRATLEELPNCRAFCKCIDGSKPAVAKDLHSGQGGQKCLPLGPDSVLHPYLLPPHVQFINSFDIINRN
jgi:hypothetical protein